ncbi:CatB-related O-acetyltransferase [Plebeiibacterium sediminum]|uniref:CatB-related O-acetyltransferase n=1 Tax=Plebeiibacterium sediminum TaxID=2992112 RepID=A0AAE3M8H3_9BACT|nr:CatB-related O-acetyltransferase [Plebeiobacterium sediminum]MCW3789191.1 CatB-related O-acetyltransferase [Plebeiobacterium sediminum]
MRNKIINKLIYYLNKIKKQPPKERLLFTNTFPELKKYNIAEFTYGRPEVIDWEQGASLSIGKYCSIAKGVKILLGGEHITSNITTYPFKVINQDFHEVDFPFKCHDHECKLTDACSKGDVIIGNDVWIGRDAMILSGVNIGDGAIIGARAVIAKNIEPYSVVVGNPGKVIRKRFDDETITVLLKSQWWHWSNDKVQRHLPNLMSKIDKNLNTWLNE